MDACPFCTEIAVISRATFVNDVKVVKWVCGHCDEIVEEQRLVPKVYREALEKVLLYLDIETTNELRRQVG